jgi:hypothetical protein
MESDEDNFSYLRKSPDFDLANRDFDDEDDGSNSNAEIVFSTTSASASASVSSAVSSNQNSPRTHSGWSHTPVTVDE